MNTKKGLMFVSGMINAVAGFWYAPITEDIIVRTFFTIIFFLGIFIINKAYFMKGD